MIKPLRLIGRLISTLNARTRRTTLLTSALLCWLLAPAAVPGQWTRSTIDDLGSTGQNSSLVALSDDILLVSYEGSGLRFARSGDGGRSWTTSTIDPGDTSGDTSIAAIDDQTIFVSYHRFTAGDLMLARSTDGGTSWQTDIVADGPGIGDYGGHNSIAVVDVQTIFISYDDSQFGASDLKLAKSTDGGDSWELITIDDGPNPVDVGTHNSIAAADDQTIFFSYRNTTEGTLQFAGSTDGGGSGDIVTVDDGGGEVVGYYSSIDAVDADRIFISYENRSSSDLNFARSDDGGATWTASTVASDGNVGRGASLHARDADQIFITYQNVDQLSLEIAESTDGGSTWILSTIDDGGNSAGLTSSVATTPDGGVHVTYQRNETGGGAYRLLHARRTDLVLTASGSCPGAVTIELDGVTRDGTVQLAGATAAGSTFIPGGDCAGTVLDLDSPRLLTALPADGNGEISIERTLAAGACGKLLQAVDLTNCGTSERIALPK